MKFDFSTPLTLGEVITILISAVPVLATIVTVIVKKFRKVFYAEPIIRVDNCDGLCMNIIVDLHNITPNTILITDAVVVKRLFGILKKDIWGEDILNVPINVIGNGHVELSIRIHPLFYDRLADEKNKFINLWIPYLCVTDASKRKHYIRLISNVEFLKSLIEFYLIET